MIYVGIDVASEKHDVCIMSEEGEIFGKNSKSRTQRMNIKNSLAKLMKPRSSLKILKCV